MTLLARWRSMSKEVYKYKMICVSLSLPCGSFASKSFTGSATLRRAAILPFRNVRPAVMTEPRRFTGIRNTATTEGTVPGLCTTVWETEKLVRGPTCICGSSMLAYCVYLCMLLPFLCSPCYVALLFLICFNIGLHLSRCSSATKLYC